MNGNIISGDGATNIVYDVRNLPIRMQKGGQTIIYRYNAAGQRIYKKVIGTTITEEHYVMNGSELVAVLKNGVVDYWKTSYGRYERSSGTFRAKYYITDHLGSTRVVLDESGQRVEAYDYYAFGLVLPGRGFGNTTKEKFTGKERDSETGWDYFGARYYNPTIARWMNVDPLADKYPSWSPYNYVANNPITSIDPNGKEIIVTTSTDANGHKNVVITYTAKLINLSRTRELSQIELDNIALSLKQSIEQVWSKRFEKEGISVTTIANISVADQANYISKGDHTIAIYDDDEMMGAYGIINDSSERYMSLSMFTLADSFTNPNKFHRTVAHEFGHHLGFHSEVNTNPDAPYFKGCDAATNIMAQSSTRRVRGSAIEAVQILYILSLPYEIHNPSGNNIPGDGVKRNGEIYWFPTEERVLPKLEPLPIPMLD